ncbi:MAG: T9SS type A sorting domain-containing protein [Flavobacteriaceae bacterium]
MKTISTLLIILVCSMSFYAQTTYVPDNNFEQALIDLGYDTVLDDFVTTASINTITELDVQSKGISDLTGIEDFLSLIKLTCNNNNLTNIDVSNLLSLEEFTCYINQLTSINVTSNTSLKRLDCWRNPINTLDISTNTLLTFLQCAENNLSILDISNNNFLQTILCGTNNLSNIDVSSKLDLRILFCFDNNLIEMDVSNNTLLLQYYVYNNSITNIDLSQNPELTRVRCQNNLLNTLNLKNGNNTNINQFFAYGNPNLLCVDVDDEIYATTNWTSIDMQTIFSEDCAFALSATNETIQSEFSIYPNPVNDILTINLSNSLSSEASIKIYDLLGKLILVEEINNQKNQINISKLKNGNYFIKIETENTTTTKQFIKQ